MKFYNDKTSRNHNSGMERHKRMKIVTFILLFQAYYKVCSQSFKTDCFLRKSARAYSLNPHGEVVGGVT